MLDISGKIDPGAVSVLEAVTQSADTLGIAAMVIGATARDMVLHLGYGAPVARATRDVDFAIQVRSWPDFLALKQSLVRESFAETRAPHRLLSPAAIPVDIVPFGGVADAAGSIGWPPSGEVVMSVMGFDDAFHAAAPIRIRQRPPLDVMVVTPIGMVLLKLISWQDRAVEMRDKDAKDLRYILEHYEVIPAVLEELYEPPDILASYDWDVTLAAAHRAGHEVWNIAGGETRQMLKDFFVGQGKEGLDSLAMEMSPASAGQFERNQHILDALAAGFMR